MISTGKQLANTKAKLAQLEESLASLEANKESKKLHLYKLERAGLIGLIRDLKNEIAEYEQLSKTNCISARCEIADLPNLLIRARIVKKISQSDLAKKINIEPQQIQRYESNGYDGVGFNRLIEIHAALGLDAKCEIVVFNYDAFMLPDNVSPEEIIEEEKSLINEHLLANSI